MVLKTYTAAELAQFISSEEFTTQKAIPISRHRGLSHFNNPILEKDDVIMIMAFDEAGNLAGYLGILPGKVKDGKQTIKAGWMSCLWIDIKQRGKGIARQLVEQALISWNGKILATEFTKEAKALYDKTGKFSDLRISTGIRGYLRFNLHKILPAKSSLFGKVKPLLFITDILLNVPNDLRIKAHKNKLEKNKSYAIHTVNSLDNEIARFVSDMKDRELFGRSTSELQWILDYPWILQAPEDELSKKYHFSSVSENFKMSCFKIVDNNELIRGFMIITARDKSVKIPYLYFDPSFVDQISNAIFDQLISMKANEVTLFHPPLIDHWEKNKHPFIHSRNVTRHYIQSNFLDEEPINADLYIQDGDGDCAFT